MMRGVRGLKQWILNRYAAFIGALLLYTWIMSLVGGMPPLLGAWRSEIPLLLYVYVYLNIITRPSKWQPVVTATLILLVYAVFDINFMQLGKPPRVVEIREIPEMLNVIPPLATAAIVIFVGFPLVSFFKMVRFRPLTAAVFGAVPIGVIVMTVAFGPNCFLYAFEKVNRPVTSWSDIQSARDIGRIWMMLYHEAERKSNIAKISNYKDDAAFLQDAHHIASTVNSLKKKNNVHLVVLESFLDPDLFSNVSFSPKPAHPEFEKLAGNKGSISIAPLFGGRPPRPSSRCFAACRQ